jgi:hypothetical protein
VLLLGLGRPEVLELAVSGARWWDGLPEVEVLPLLPLEQIAPALLGALVADVDPAESARSLAAARSAVQTLAADLPPGVRSEWLGRPDIAALLES